MSSSKRRHQAPMSVTKLQPGRPMAMAKEEGAENKQNEGGGCEVVVFLVFV